MSSFGLLVLLVTDPRQLLVIPESLALQITTLPAILLFEVASATLPFDTMLLGLSGVLLPGVLAPDDLLYSVPTLSNTELPAAPAPDTPLHLLSPLRFDDKGSIFSSSSPKRPKLKLFLDFESSNDPETITRLLSYDKTVGLSPATGNDQTTIIIHSFIAGIYTVPLQGSYSEGATQKPSINSTMKQKLLRYMVSSRF